MIRNAALVAALVWGVSQDTARAQEPLIRHSALECLPNDQFAQVTAVIEPGDEIRTSKLYFRSDKYSDFYYVEMEPLGEPEDAFRGVLPVPSGQTQNVSFATSKSSTNRSMVFGRRSMCRR